MMESRKDCVNESKVKLCVYFMGNRCVSFPVEYARDVGRKKAV